MRLQLAAVGFLHLLAIGFAHAAPPSIGGCQVFPADNYWNTPVDNLPVHPSSNAWVSTIGNAAHLHADWGNVLADNYGIPFITVTGAQPLVTIHNYSEPGPLFDPSIDYSDESDPGPYPIPPDAPIEGGAPGTGDTHVLVIETTNCVLYELYNANGPQPDNTWFASSYAKWPLDSNALRPAGWTSADAAGLPIFPGLVRYDEAASGEITHAIRFTAQQIWGRDAATGDQKYLWPGRHASGSNTTVTRPPMGARFRLKASYAIPSTFDPLTQTILRAMQKYGLVLADGGSNWYFQGVSDTRWPDAVFSEVASVAGSNFEAVDASMLQVDPDSAQANQSVVTDPPRLANISTRMQVLTGNNVMIGGFIIGGSTPKTVAITVTGPSLAAYGIANPLANPTLTIVRSSDQAVIASNDNWQADANAALLQASGFAPSNALESGLYITLAPGAYTAIVSGSGGGTGVGLIGVFELDRPDVPLVNISTRGQVLTGNDVMIGGFIIQGSGPQTVAITATGPLARRVRHHESAREPHAADRALVGPIDDRHQRRLAIRRERGAAAGERLRAVRPARIGIAAHAGSRRVHGDRERRRRLDRRGGGGRVHRTLTPDLECGHDSQRQTPSRDPRLARCRVRSRIRGAGGALRRALGRHRDLRRGFLCVRPRHRRAGEMLGRQRRRGARHRIHHGFLCPRERGGIADRHHGHRDGWRADVRRHGRRRREVLGTQLGRPGRRRHHRAPWQPAHPAD